MADGFIVRRGGGSAGAKPPTFNLVSLNYRRIEFTITNNENTEVEIFWELGDDTPDANILTLGALSTSSTLTVDNLIGNTEYSLFAFANSSSKNGSDTTEFTFITARPLQPAITINSIDNFFVKFTLQNLNEDSATVYYDITGDLNGTNLVIPSNSTSAELTISNLTDNTTYTLFAKAVINGASSLNTETQFTTLVITYINATGGNIVGTYEVNGQFYKYHEFNSNGTFAIQSLGSGDFNLLEYLVIAGGASGGADNTNQCGGGGAGGYRSSVFGELSGRNTTAEPGIAATLGNKSVSIGGGGAGRTSISVGAAGGNSSFLGITSTGGGGGGTYGVGGNSGGSGGGAGAGASSGISGAAGIAGQGFNGGNSTGAVSCSGLSRRAGGGGGGAGQAGGNGFIAANCAISGGKGGDGRASLITGTSIIRAGGGGSASGVNGLGSGIANTGGGNKGSSGSTSPAAFSGVVIVRYRVGGL